MQYSLGIDAGGTYTDTVIMEDSTGNILDSNKALTTYPDLITGIKSAIEGLNEEYLKKVKLVSVSTTLATNTILENTGYPVGLILIGDYEIPDKSSLQHYIQVSGGHTTTGAEMDVLDIESIKEFVLRTKDKVSAFAVSSYFSVRNPSHEIQAKEEIQKITEMPVVCGHELSQSLGAFERAVTAYLNAQLIPIAHQFINTVLSVIEDKGIDARLLMLRCDGSVVSIEEALKKPIESIFSGPAASLIGASFLAKKDTCAVIDVGGTSTDVSMIHDALAELTDEGAKVGGWKTKVRAIKMETSAMGGDTHVWVKNRKIYIGPRRVIPLCVASEQYPGFIEQLKKGRTPARLELGENIQPTKFFVRTGKDLPEITSAEKEILNIIEDEPVSISDLFWRLNKFPSTAIIDSLIQKRLVQAIGFTPTDALHVLGEYNEWNTEASETGATLLGRLSEKNRTEFASHVKELVAYNMALNLMSYILEDVDKSQIKRIIEGDYFTLFKVKLPVVLLGGPVRAYVNELNDLLDAEIILPEYAEVGNAVGALAGKGIKRIEIMIRAGGYFNSEKVFLIFSPRGRDKVPDYKQALDFACKLGRELIFEYMEESGFDTEDVEIKVTKNDITVSGVGIPIETTLTFVGIGKPVIEED
ncbi:Hydantoinase/oxoprolinase [Methanosalsum zhilinae DSM 4017]|uniref:Hydantoinase/oxoprolinase n=1 Tax=Methanosalsum zhilinae (strain DSM 4017 / NBRC 107636 / OCM 62 / WeN5) TaxID=679901 RepID=F7XPR2_METZD|nr:hydantoinase/oxoprolinase family protein [Methanosalsum zhilinae]AEH60332.1 Hydantoinase/oxoprolinase [Methanosalsum zhilinae DSM 4017]